MTPIARRAEVRIQLKPGILDPQGETLDHALAALGYDDAANIRVGKWITFDVEGESEAEIERRVGEMCDKLLANPVIERYEFDLLESTE